VYGKGSNDRFDDDEKSRIKEESARMGVIMESHYEEHVATADSGFGNVGSDKEWMADPTGIAAGMARRGEKIERGGPTESRRIEGESDGIAPRGDTA
jgi:hypothetical protein